MSRIVRATLLALSCFIGFVNAASAADLAGQWALSFPENATLWTFTQFGPSFEASTGAIPGDPDVNYHMNGLTFGPLLVAAMDFTELEGGGGTISLGVMLGRVSGERMSGLIISPTLGLLRFDGQQFSTARRR
jgi:hypothetical protein